MSFIGDQWKILIHNENGLNDELYNQPSFYSSRWESKTYEIRGKRLNKTSTRSRPCQRYWPEACREIFLKEKAKREMNCTLSILNSGIQMDNDTLKVMEG